MLIEALNLGRGSDVTDIHMLTGGVASDIASLRVGQRQYCVKFALPKLKVAADWFAPVHRNAAEYTWLKVAAEIVPESAVSLYGRSEDLHGFAMEFVTGDDVYLWKSALMAGQGSRNEARAVGDMLGRIHAASVAPDFDRSPFENRDDFRALRIEPYLTFTAAAHPAVAAELNSLSEWLYHSDTVLVHGDVSPKNILIREGGPIILDAECATMGDAAFDLSFCLNHLVLKALRLSDLRSDPLEGAAQLWAAYKKHVTWEDTDNLEAKVCKLVPALMLGRVDGKSPVDYLDEIACERVRATALAFIRKPAVELDQFIGHLTQSALGAE
jgi:aminoglycoside phosphotransferase (APT) family kinase protein